MRKYFPKRTSGAPLHTLSKLIDVGFFIPPPLFLRQCIAIFAVAERVAVARYRMICLVLKYLGLRHRRCGIPIVMAYNRVRGVVYSCRCRYIFLIYCFYHLTCLCYNFYGICALVDLKLLCLAKDTDEGSLTEMRI